MRLRVLAAVMAGLLLSTGAAADIAGTASVIDGDTLEIHGQRIRLHGIDAPESAQTCRTANGKAWRCGQQAALALSDRIGRRPVTCREKDKDRYGRIVAVCSAGGEDLNGWLVSQGWALAYRQYATDYVGQEASAQAARAGIWQGEFVTPWDWRRGKRLASETANENAAVQERATAGGRSGNCAIKGNISSKGERIYHVPGGRSYAATRIDAGRGERWFCSEAEAQAAGWRRARQ